MSTYDCGIVFSVSIKYRHSTEKGKLAYCDYPGDCIKAKVCLHTASLQKSVLPCQKAKRKRCGSVKYFTRIHGMLPVNCMQLILGDISILKSVCLPVAYAFTVTACTWNVTMYTADPKQQPNSLPESLYVVSYLSEFYLRFEFPMAVKMSLLLFWVVTLYGLVDRYQHFGETCWRWRQNVAPNCWYLPTSQHDNTISQPRRTVLIDFIC
jgi:hypothetical protein